MKNCTPLSLIKTSSFFQQYNYYVFLIFMLSIFSCDEVENRKLYAIGNGYAMMNIGDDDFKTDSTKQLFLEGFRYYTQEKFVRARLLYLQAYEQDSTNSILLNALANLECQIENYEKSDFYFGKAVSRDPENVDTYINYGKCLMNQKKYSEAIEVMSPRYKTFFNVELSESAQLKFFSLSYNLAICHQELNNCAEALNFVKVALKYCEQQDMRENYIDLKEEIENDCDPDERLS